VGIDAARCQILICSLALCAAGCRRASPDLAGYTLEEPPRQAVALDLGDPASASQLVSGWYPVERNAWRWTARNFAVVLRPPPAAARKGAILRFRFSLPDMVLSRLKQLTLSASVLGTRLAPETYHRVGPAIYQRDVSAALLPGESVRIDFSLDKALPAGDFDPRELGVIANQVGLETR
jgi:hypothetical protein